VIAIALVYWLLCMRVYAWLSIGLNGNKGVYSLKIRWLLFGMNLEGTIAWNSIFHGPEHVLRYQSKPKQKKRRTRRSAGKMIRKAVVQAFRVIRAEAVLRIGMENAASAAMTAGAVQAALCAAAAVRHVQDCQVRVDAQTGRNCFLADIRCIFCASLGDIMFEAAGAVRLKNKKENGKRDSIGKASY